MGGQVQAPGVSCPVHLKGGADGAYKKEGGGSDGSAAADADAAVTVEATAGATGEEQFVGPKGGKAEAVVVTVTGAAGGELCNTHTLSLSHTFVHTHTSSGVYTHTHKHTCVCLHAHTRTFTHAHTYMHKHTQTHVYPHTHIYTHKHHTICHTRWLCCWWCSSEGGRPCERLACTCV
jgi:hypothetical protein